MNLAIFAPQALRNSLLLVSFSVGNWQKNKQLPGSNQTMVPVPSSSLHRGRESFCYWKITLQASFYVTQELLAAEAAGGQDWEHPAQNTQKATVTPLCYRFWGATSKQQKIDSVQLKNTWLLSCP